MVWVVEVGMVDEDEEEEGILLEVGIIMGMDMEEVVVEVVIEEEDIKIKVSLVSLLICSVLVNRNVFCCRI